MPSPGYRVSGKEVEVRDSGSRHHQLCGCCNLHLIQSHVHLLMAQQQESFLPFSSRQSLSCCLSHVAKRSTPKPRGPLPFPLEPHGPFFTSPKLPDPGPLSFPSEPRGILLFYFRTTWTFIYLLASEPRGLLFPSEPHGLLSLYFGAAWSTPFSPKTLWSSPFYGCRT